MPPPPLKWHAVQFIWPNNSFPASMADLFPSNRAPIGSCGGGVPPLGKRPVMKTWAGPCCASGGVSCCADALLAERANNESRAIGRSCVATVHRSGFGESEDI